MSSLSCSALLALTLGGCQMGWSVARVGIDDDTPLSGRAIVRVAVDGACDAQGEVVAWTSLNDGPALTDFELPAGRYCFSIEAWSADCSVLAQGVTLTTLPRLGDVRTELTPVTDAMLAEEPARYATLLAACRVSDPIWPQSSAALPSVDATSLRIRVRRRLAPHHPRPDYIYVELRPCGADLSNCHPASDEEWPGAGRSADIEVREQRERYTVQLDEIPPPEGGWRGRIAWRTVSCVGERCLRSEARSFLIGQSARDLDADGRDELMIGDGSRLWLYPSGSPPDFVQEYELCSMEGVSLGAIPLGDDDGDGFPDVLVFAEGCPTPGILRYDLDERGFVLRTPPFAAEQYWAMGDRDGDGLSDLLLLNGTEARVRYGGSGDGTALLDGLPSADDVLSVASGGDLDADGHDDIALLDRSGERLILVFGAGRDETTASCEVTLDAPARQLRMARDGNGDGRADLVWLAPRVADTGRDDLTVLDVSRECEALEPTTSPVTADEGSQVTVGDVNADALADLVVTFPSESRIEVYLGETGNRPWIRPNLSYRHSVTSNFLVDEGETGTTRFAETVDAFGRAAIVVRGALGVDGFDLAVAGGERQPPPSPVACGDTSPCDDGLECVGGRCVNGFVPLVYLFEWNDGEPLNSVVLSSPADPRAGDLAFGASLP